METTQSSNGGIFLTIILFIGISSLVGIFKGGNRKIGFFWSFFFCIFFSIIIGYIITSFSELKTIPEKTLSKTTRIINVILGILFLSIGILGIYFSNKEIKQMGYIEEGVITLLFLSIGLIGSSIYLNLRTFKKS